MAKMIERCGPDSGIPVVMANDALFAGIDTTGNTASFLLYHLATHPEKQENLYQEILKVNIILFRFYTEIFKWGNVYFIHGFRYMSVKFKLIYFLKFKAKH